MSRGFTDEDQDALDAAFALGHGPALERLAFHLAAERGLSPLVAARTCAQVIRKTRVRNLEQEVLRELEAITTPYIGVALPTAIGQMQATWSDYLRSLQRDSRLIESFEVSVQLTSVGHRFKAKVFFLPQDRPFKQSFEVWMDVR
jgi:hypothetical protein